MLEQLSHLRLSQQNDNLDHTNPYHRLIINCQIIRDSFDDPVQDTLLAGTLFFEQGDTLQVLRNPASCR